MTSGPSLKLRPAPANDTVGDRHSLVAIGMLAVWVACVVFGAARLVVTLSTGKLTPWLGERRGRRSDPGDCTCGIGAGRTDGPPPPPTVPLSSRPLRSWPRWPTA